MREEFKPGDLSVRLGFARINSLDPETDRVRPSIEISDHTSGLTLRIELTAAQLAEMLAGGSAEVSRSDVTGFGGLARWGKYLKIITAQVPAQLGDLKTGDPRTLPHVAVAIRELEADGYTCGTPRRNNTRQWVITGRRYDDEP